MRTVRTKVYQFSELSKAAQEKAIEAERNSYLQHGEPLEWFEEYCQEQAKVQGFDDCKFMWSLSSCQGDGLSFKCDTLDTERMIKEALPNVKESQVKVLREGITYELKGNTGHYAYAAKGDVDIWIDIYKNGNYSNVLSLVDTVREYVENKYMALCKELEKEGYNWIESEYEESAVIDRITANEYEFTKEGNRF